ncbi:PepSY domain-containing protein [Pseudomonas sp. M30-35]|uniref:PepSY-associated TM helix domain-containing protein n=1 Tax=Pseudomonas sp. M30-35 TaxID=1981174 RepID=UPI000B3D3A7E|nr:PepSY domain-containing protein [Pseudomonas sp. M30-35]ARU87269.1 peptidase [Pseudomonas sp. M30-35]
MRDAHTSESPVTVVGSSSLSFYNLAWRWHFYAGLLVIPFFIMLSVTGIIYLFKPQLDQLMYGDLLQVPVAEQRISADRQMAQVMQAYPKANVSKYLPPVNEQGSAQFVITTADATLNVFVNPYNGEILGAQDAEDNLQAIARKLHGELMIGTVGDRLVELAAGWGIVLVLSGLYLWWPRGTSKSAQFWPRLASRGRLFWRDVHAVVGFWGSLLLLFMLLTGMTWTGFWGAKFAGAWNHFPAAMWDDVPQSNKLAGSLNTSTNQTVPWATEVTPMPESDPHAAHNGMTHMHSNASTAQVGLQQVVDSAEARGVHPGFSVSLPVGERGVYSVSVFADDPRNDATLHIDQYSGKVLADIRWSDYGLVARTVETGVMLHEGKMFGLANQLLMLLVCLMILLSSVSGLVLWWKRRPQGRFGVPPIRHDLPIWRGGMVIMLVVACLFPLVGASLLLVAPLDWLFTRRRINAQLQIS